MDAAGAVVAAYVGCTGSSCAVKVADRAPGGRFGTPDVVTPPVAQDANLDLAAGPAGAAAVITGPAFAAERALLAHRRPGGAFADVVPVSPAGTGAFAPRVAMDGEGNALAAGPRVRSRRPAPRSPRPPRSTPRARRSPRWPSPPPPTRARQPG